MTVIRLADLRIGITGIGPETEAFLSAYRISGSETDLCVSVTEEQLAREREHLPASCSKADVESVCLHRAIANMLPFHDAMLLHAATITYRGKGYAFAAVSGTGKSTHISFWKQAFGDAVEIVNGDKPILRLDGNTVYAYGTPWAGKENWQRNVRAPLDGLCFLRRGPVDSIRQISPKEALEPVLSQILLPRDPAATERTLLLLDRILQSVPLWELSCTPCVHAATVAMQAMTARDRS